MFSTIYNLSVSSLYMSTLHQNSNTNKKKQKTKINPQPLSPTTLYKVFADSAFSFRSALRACHNCNTDTLHCANY